MFIPIVPPGSAKPIAPYVHGARADNTIYVSGTLAIDQQGSVVHPGDAAGQTRYILDQIKSVVEAGGGSLSDIAYNMIFISDVKHYGEMNRVYAEYFPNPPARFCIVSQLVREEFLIEIASIAHVQST
ncbi:RidA family protein [Mesorhizobium sp. YM1C-6-2]|jgi:aminoacrylate peracid reductase|uniref:RidA family protein n=1 Tax=Mesorhizobium sp. YM1C-6-2 TaxID=1827501 RepID=UPI000EF1C3B5|nr:RidA family protein [Mesorhizobium sp. YM1C-6-2]RLP24032.1 pyrimidine utilization protein C [Mesorhizobium sp. YM1C-6-2]